MISIQYQYFIHFRHELKNSIVKMTVKKIKKMNTRLSKGILIVKEGKGSKRREIPLSDSMTKDFKKYITVERPGLLKNNALEMAFFLNNRGERRRGNSLNKRLKQIISRTKNQSLIDKSITLHNLRHSIATHLMENGAGFENVRDFLGHIEIDTTQLYAIRRKRNKTYQI